MPKSSFIMLKPDALKAHLETDILKYFTDAKMRIVRSKTVLVNEPLILAHYQEVIERLNLPDFPNRIKKEFVGHEVKIYELESDNNDIVAQVRSIVGPTDPAKADPSTIRGHFGSDTMERSLAEKRLLRNLIHASDSDENAKKEIELWFK